MIDITRPHTLRELIERPGCEVRISYELNRGTLRASWETGFLLHDTGGPEAIEWATTNLRALRSVPADSIRNVKVCFRDVSQWAEVAIEQPKVVQP